MITVDLLSDDATTYALAHLNQNALICETEVVCELLGIGPDSLRKYLSGLRLPRSQVVRYRIAVLAHRGIVGCINDEIARLEELKTKYATQR